MSDFVLDASALLALLNDENGADLVQSLLPVSAISVVNLAEVVARLSLLGMPQDQIRESLAYLGLEPVPFDEEEAFQAGCLAIRTHPLCLSLGDRACLALALNTGAAAVTADCTWSSLDLEVPIKLIR